MKMEFIEQLAQLVDDGSDSNLSPKIPPITSEVEKGGVQLTDILNSGDGVTRTDLTTPIENHSVRWPSENVNTLTSTLIQKADDLGASFRSKLDHVTELMTAGPESFSLQTVMLVELEMHSVTLEMDLLSGGVHKATQYIDQLSKIS